MILIIVCHAIVLATTTFYLFIACKGRTVDLKESCFWVLLVPPTTDDFVCLCSTRCATSLHKNMLNITVELFWIDDSFLRSWKDDLDDDLHGTAMTHAMTVRGASSIFNNNKSSFSAPEVRFLFARKSKVLVDCFVVLHEMGETFTAEVETNENQFESSAEIIFSTWKWKSFSAFLLLNNQ